MPNTSFEDTLKRLPPPLATQMSQDALRSAGFWRRDVFSGIFPDEAVGSREGVSQLRLPPPPGCEQILSKGGRSIGGI